MLKVIIIVVGLVVFALMWSPLVDNIILKSRRKKHPKYFELYDDAFYESMRIGRYRSNRMKLIENKVKMWANGYEDGECTKEDLVKNINSLCYAYIEVVDDCSAGNKLVEEKLKLADKYAKDNGLKWGTLY